MGGWQIHQTIPTKHLQLKLKIGPQCVLGGLPVFSCLAKNILQTSKRKFMQNILVVKLKIWLAHPQK